MRVWLLSLGLLAVTGCNFAGYEGDAPAEPAEPEPVATQEAAIKVRTICADAVAREIDPMVDVLIADAIIYWASEPMLAGLKHTPGQDCDVPVHFTDESHWTKSKGSARAQIKGKQQPGCRPVELQLREAHWERVKDENWQHYVVFHEFGHLLCLPHADTGIMKYDGNLGVN